MTEFQYLQFFDKKGQNHQFQLDSERGVYLGAINLPRISVNLIETEHLFILEEFIQGFGKPKAISLGHTIIEMNIKQMSEGSNITFTDNSGQTYIFNRNSYIFLHELITDIQTVLGTLAPYNVSIEKDKITIEIIHSSYFNIFGYEYKNVPLLVIPSSTTEVNYTINTNDYYPRFRIRLEDTDDTKMFFYDVEVKDSTPYITKFDTLERTLNFDSNDTQDPLTLQKSTASLIDGASVINVGFQSEVEVYELNKIIIEFSNRIGIYETIAEVEVYAESVAEEERFKHVLANFGRNIPENDFFCFRESDIKEDNIDYQILNAKRKEYILQLSELDPYIGSYKGLLNALKFFGYGDLRVKEWWNDLSKPQNGNEKFTLVDIVGGDKDVTRSTQFRKTNMFSLVYDLNVQSGDEDEFGIPLTEETFEYSFEEILLKLFCLKEILKRDYMPINSKIIDITGEGIYFDKYNIKTWNDQNTSIYVNSGIDIDWTTDDIFGLISEVRTLIYAEFNPCKEDIPPICTYTVADVLEASTIPLVVGDTVCIEDLEQTYDVFQDTSSTTSGGYPLVTSEGVYYTTKDGGNFNMGALYLIQSSITKLIYSFTSSDNIGFAPMGSIVLQNNLLYIETVDGGDNSLGTLVEFNKDTKEMKLILAFDSITGHNNSLPLTTSTDKIFVDCFVYMAHALGGTNNFGTILKVNVTNGHYTVLENITTNPPTGVPGLSKGVVRKYGNNIFMFVDNYVYKIELNTDIITPTQLPVGIPLVTDDAALRGGVILGNKSYTSYNGLGNNRICEYDMLTETFNVYNGGAGLEFWGGFIYQNKPHFFDIFTNTIYELNSGVMSLSPLQSQGAFSILPSLNVNDKVYYFARNLGDVNELYVLDLALNTNTLVHDITTSFFTVDGNNFIDVLQSPIYLQNFGGYNQCPSSTLQEDLNIIPLNEPKIANTFSSHYIELDDEKYNKCVPTRKGSEVGFPIDLETTSFDLSWDESDFIWDGLFIAPNATWDTLGFFDFYELEWQIAGSEGHALDMGYCLNDRGKIADFKQRRYIVPYIGKYTITLMGIELNGNISYETKHSEIEVGMYNSDFTIITKLVDVKEIKIWDDMNGILWSDISGDWDRPKITDSEMDEAFSYWDSLKLNQYRNSDYKVLNKDTNLYEPLTLQLLSDNNSYNFDWNKYVDFSYMTYDMIEDISFSQINNVNWKAFEFNFYQRAGFEITNIPLGAFSITINGITYNFPPHSAPPIPQIEWDSFILGLETTFPEWEFTARPIALPTYIHAVYKESSYNEDNYDITQLSSGVSATIQYYEPFQLNGIWTVPSPLIESIIITADNEGIDGNLIQIGYGDGSTTLSALVTAWNSANPTNTATLTEINGSGYIPSGPSKAGPGELFIPTGGVDAQTTQIDVEYSNGYYTYDDIFINRSGIQLGVGSPFLLVADASKVFGKSEIIWRIFNNKTNEKILDVNNLWLHFIIPQQGIFDIECEIKDSNGNTKIVRKNSFIISI